MMKLLRNSEFQDLLGSYPRKARSFWIAEEVEDSVDSRWIIRDGLGREHQPDDYLHAFASFVRSKQKEIDAIRILLDRPRDWSTDALTSLRETLRACPERFTEDLLQRAHEITYHKALVDIISMVKHAAHDEEPLLTAGERVDKALERLRKRRKFTTEQQAWLDRIREHLVANLTIDEDDFDAIPVLQQAGGWGRASRAFAGTLPELLKALNEAVAA
jgi:type I restriction enzyme R subunit